MPVLHAPRCRAAIALATQLAASALGAQAAAGPRLGPWRAWLDDLLGR